MSLDQAIYAWLDALTDDKNCDKIIEKPRSYKDNEHIRKRRRLNPPTPETSQSSRNSNRRMNSPRHQASPGKRGRPGGGNGVGDESQETPRPHGRRLKAPRSESSCSLPSSSSARSGYSSPSKQISALERSARGVISRELSTFQHQPPSLEALLDRIDLISAGQGILPSSERASFDQLGGEMYHDWKWTRRGAVSDRHFSDQRHELGHTPPPETVHQILYQAAFCNGSGSSEADWNMEVHHRVLEAALRPLNRPGANQLVDFRSSTTASIIPDYHMANFSPKKVDFCIYIDPSCDSDHPDSLRTIRALQDALPDGMFNHTNLITLRDRPIALSIETKRTGEGWDNARLQMGIWNAAHWEFLRRLSRMRHRAANELSRISQDETYMPGSGQDTSSSVDQAVQLPDFLPGIIIQGHDWHLVITTREGDKTTFWQKMTFGSTSSSRGIYQIICTLQLLAHWARDEFWPWVRGVVSEWPCDHGQMLIV